MPLTQAELDALPKNTDLWFYRPDFVDVRKSELDSKWSNRNADYFLSEKEAYEHGKVDQILKKLKGD